MSINATPGYRAHLARVLVTRALQEAAQPDPEESQ